MRNHCSNSYITLTDTGHVHYERRVRGGMQTLHTAMALQTTLHQAAPVPARARSVLVSRRRCLAIAAGKPRGQGGSDDVWRQLGSLADKYLPGGGIGGAQRTAAGPPPVQAVHVLLAALLCVWLASSSAVAGGGSGALKLLTLEHSSAKWWSVVTDGFCSHSSQLLARNLFFGYMFGRVVNNTESGGALWLTFLLSAAGGSTAAWLFLPRRAPLHGCGSSAAMFGLFAAATLLNRHKQWHWQRVFELAVLLPFVCQQLLSGHAGLSQWCLLYGVKLGAWVPLLGGLAGAAAAAALLALARLVLQAVQQQQAAQQQQQQQAPGSQQQQPAAADPVKALLAQALTQLLRRVL